MTNEELNLEIAQLIPCGTCDGSGGVDSGGSTPWGAGIDIPCPECENRMAQAYTADLNACREMEEALGSIDCGLYADALLEIIRRDGVSLSGRGSFTHITATARQRAEAFYQVMKGGLRDE